MLDASAILAFLRGEQGAEVVAGYRGDALVSAVNVAEAGARLADLGANAAEVRRSIALMGMEIVPFDADQAHEAADIRDAHPSPEDCRSATGHASNWQPVPVCRH